MPGRAELDPDVLVDSLVPDVVDGLREDLHAQFGVRPFRMFLVRRMWDGETVGEGAYLDRDQEVTPRPRVRNLSEYEQQQGGMVERGVVKVTEVSLTYHFDELTGAGLAESEEFLVRLEEGNGQGQPKRFYRLAKPPFPDREQDMGWALFLRPVDVPGCEAP